MQHLIKLAHYQKELAQFRNSELVIPRRVQIDPVAFCNHDCQFCTYRYTRNEDMNALFNLKDIIPLSKMLEIFDDCVELGVKAVEITGGGEPSLHPHFTTMLSELNARGLEIGLITNGSWRDTQFESAVRALKKAKWVRFSLDAATPETHRITHASKRGDFERALNAIKAVTSSNIMVGISFIVQKQNMPEIVDAVRLAEKMRVNYIRFGGVVFEGERIENIELSLQEHAETAELIHRLSESSTVEIIDNFSTRSCTDFQRYMPGDTCYYSYLGTTIGADLRLYPCCVWKYRPDGVIADLNRIGFAEAWRSGVIDTFYKSFDIAQQCNRCYLKDKNDFVASLLDRNVRHINFV